MTDDADDSRRAAFTPRGYAASVRDLQRALGKAGPPARTPPPKPFNWLRRHSWIVLRVTQLTPGASVVLSLSDGRVFVGDVEHCRGSWLTLLLWGVRGAAVRFEAADIERCTLVGPHPWTEETEVRRRQGSGLPAVFRT